METRKVSELELVEVVSETVNVLIEDNGATKRIQANKIGAVKTVNGVEPDENGNVEVVVPEVPVTSVNGKTGNVVIDIPESFSGSWNDLTDKPFGTEMHADNYLSLDENSEYNAEGVYDNTFYYLGDMLEVVEDKPYGIMVDSVVVGEVRFTQGRCSDCFMDVDGEELYVTFGIPNADNNIFEYDFGFSVQKYGVYAKDSDSLHKLFSHSDVRIVDVTIKQLDEVYIPNTIARTADLPEVPDEKVYEIKYGGNDPWRIVETIETAYANGAICLVKKDDRMYFLTSFKMGGEWGEAVFASFENKNIYYLGCNCSWAEGEAVYWTTGSYPVISAASAVANAAGETVTAAEFNALLTALRNAGYLAT